MMEDGMMDDLIKRLHETADVLADMGLVNRPAIVREAIAEIERLRAVKVQQSPGGGA